MSVVCASTLALHPTHDITIPVEGMLWIKSTDLIYVYSDCVWKQVNNQQELFMTINGSTEMLSTAGTVVHRFVWPQGDLRLLSMEYSHSWSQAVPSGLSEVQGMNVVIRDELAQDILISGMAPPSTHQAFSSSTLIGYTPNPGDVMEVVVRKMQDFPVGVGNLLWLKLKVA